MKLQIIDAQSVSYFGPDLIKTIPVAVNFFVNILGAQRMDPDDFADIFFF